MRPTYLQGSRLCYIPTMHCFGIPNDRQAFWSIRDGPFSPSYLLLCYSFFLIFHAWSWTFRTESLMLDCLFLRRRWEWIDRFFKFDSNRMTAQFRMHAEYTRFRMQSWCFAICERWFIFLNVSVMFSWASCCKLSSLILNSYPLCCMWVGQWVFTLQNSDVFCFSLFCLSE